MRKNFNKSDRLAHARLGEELIAQELVSRGFQIVGRNVRVGRLEIDVIARRGSQLVFCEVRTRSTDQIVHPAETITRAKQQRIRRAAARWMASQKQRLDAHPQFDAASVILHPDDGGGPQIEYYENAF